MGTEATRSTRSTSLAAERKKSRGCIRFRLSLGPTRSVHLALFLLLRATSRVETRSRNAYSSCRIFQQSKSKQERESPQSAPIQISSSRRRALVAFPARLFLCGRFINKDIDMV